MTAAIVVTCYNRLPFTIPSLNNLFRALADPDRPVIIVDDASTDRQAAEHVRRIASGHSNIHLIEHDRNLGLGASWNDGIRLSEDLGMEAAILVDNDLLVPPHFDRRLCDDLGMFPRSSVSGFVANDTNVTRAFGAANLDFLSGEPVDVTAIGGGAMTALPVAMWRDVEGWGEAKNSFDFIDTDFFQVARSKGWKTFIDPRVIAFEFQIFAYTDPDYERKKFAVRWLAHTRTAPEGEEFEEGFRRWIGDRVLISIPGKEML